MLLADSRYSPIHGIIERQSFRKSVIGGNNEVELRNDLERRNACVVFLVMVLLAMFYHNWLFSPFSFAIFAKIRKVKINFLGINKLVH